MREVIVQVVCPVFHVPPDGCMWRWHGEDEESWENEQKLHADCWGSDERLKCWSCCRKIWGGVTLQLFRSCRCFELKSQALTMWQDGTVDLIGYFACGLHPSKSHFIWHFYRRHHNWISTFVYLSTSFKQRLESCPSQGLCWSLAPGTNEPYEQI